MNKYILFYGAAVMVAMGFIGDAMPTQTLIGLGLMWMGAACK